MDNQISIRDRWLGALCYLSFAVFVPMLSTSKSAFLSRHCRQGFALLFIEVVGVFFIWIIDATLGRLPLLGFLVVIALQRQPPQGGCRCWASWSLSPCAWSSSCLSCRCRSSDSPRPFSVKTGGCRIWTTWPTRSRFINTHGKPLNQYISVRWIHRLINCA